VKNRIKWILAVFFLVFFLLTGCDEAGEEQLLLLEEEIQEEPVVAEKDTVSEQTSSAVVIYICGAVEAPGVYELLEPARVVDAITAAGGMKEDAAFDYLNQAAVLTDGQRIYVPTGEEIENLSDNASMTTAVVQEEASASSLVNINTASRDELMTLPGIGEAKAGNIIRYREEAGSFREIEDIMLVEGIKTGLFNKIKEYICTGL